MINHFFEKLKESKSSLLLPNKRASEEFLLETLGFLFPHFSTSNCKLSCSSDSNEIKNDFNLLKIKLTIILTPLKKILKESPEKLSEDFFSQLPLIYDKLLLDAKALYLGDPAALSIDEVVLSYPGFYAIAIYRIAHALHKLGIPLLPRFLSEYAHQKTGVDIHPAATIGESFCIDHATGVVIGETCQIGNNVKIYQGVTLGALSVSKEFAQHKRHPTIEDNVVIYANATVLGGKTIIGENSVIGGNVWLTKSIPANSQVYHESKIKIKTEK